MDELKKAYLECKKYIGGHGPREVSILMEAFENVDIHTMSDIYGEGAWIDIFQEELALEAGKEAGIFFRVEPWRSRLPFVSHVIKKIYIQLPITHWHIWRFMSKMA